MNMFVVIATREREALLARTLAAVWRLPATGRIRGTIVVENGRRAGTEALVRAAPAGLGARYLFESAGNKSKALNAALAQIGEGLVVFLDDDIRVGPDLLEAYRRPLVHTANTLHPTDAPPGTSSADQWKRSTRGRPSDWLIEFLPASARGWRPNDPTEVKQKALFLGFNWAAFASDLRRVGGFSERLGPGSDAGVGDEREMQLSLIAAGLEGQYVPQALVHHWVPRDRCSPQWALERAYRNGVRRGLVTSEDPGDAHDRRIPAGLDQANDRRVDAVSAPPPEWEPWPAIRRAVQKLPPAAGCSARRHAAPGRARRWRSELMSRGRVAMKRAVSSPGVESGLRDLDRAVSDAGATGSP